MNKEEDFDCVIELENLLGVSVSKTGYYIDYTLVAFTDDPVNHLYNLAKNLDKIQKKKKVVKYLMLRKELYTLANKTGIYKDIIRVFNLPRSYTKLTLKLLGLQRGISILKKTNEVIQLTTNHRDFSIKSINK